jgi:hypothetical protein
MELKLSAEQRDLLCEILEERQRELEREIARTDHREFKLMLRQKESVLESVLVQLGAVRLVQTATA